VRTGVIVMVEEILQQSCALQDVRLWAESSRFTFTNSVLRIWDGYPGSRILIFIRPGSRIQKTATKEEGKKFVLFIPQI
jgi:hypothetical protein